MPDGCGGWRRAAVSEVPTEAEALGKWLMELFVNKDRLLDHFHRHGHFPVPSCACHASLAPLLCTGDGMRCSRRRACSSLLLAPVSPSILPHTLTPLQATRLLRPGLSPLPCTTPSVSSCHTASFSPPPPRSRLLLPPLRLLQGARLPLAAPGMQALVPALVPVPRALVLVLPWLGTRLPVS